MKTILVGIGEVAVSANIEEIIKTMALGSCVAVIVYAPKKNLVGMAHIALPDSNIGSERSKSLPGYFADKAIPCLIKHFKQHGIERNIDMIIKLAGGASIMDPNGTFNIGKRNVLAIKKLLWKNRLGARSEDIGKDYSRTVSADVETGKVCISSPGKGTWEI